MGTQGTRYTAYSYSQPYPLASFSSIPSHPSGLLYLSRLEMTRFLRSLLGPSTLIISLIATGTAPKTCRASLDVLGDPFLSLNPASYDYIDAHGLPVDVNEYSWGGYAKKRNTAVRSTGVLHPRGKHAQLLSRQVMVHHTFQSCCLLISLTQQAQCTPFQTTCLQNGGCCPNTKICGYW